MTRRVIFPAPDYFTNPEKAVVCDTETDIPPEPTTTADRNEGHQ